MKGGGKNTGKANPDHLTPPGERVLGRQEREQKKDGEKKKKGLERVLTEKTKGNRKRMGKRRGTRMRTTPGLVDIFVGGDAEMPMSMAAGKTEDAHDHMTI